MCKRVIQSGLDTYKFSNSISGDVGMLIEKNGEELGVYPHFEYGENLDGDYLMELALEFEQDYDWFHIPWTVNQLIKLLFNLVDWILFTIFNYNIKTLRHG